MYTKGPALSIPFQTCFFSWAHHLGDGPQSLLTFLNSYPPSHSLHTQSLSSPRKPHSGWPLRAHEVSHQPFHSQQLSQQPELCSAFKTRWAVLRENFDGALPRPRTSFRAPHCTIFPITPVAQQLPSLPTDFTLSVTLCQTHQ